MILFRIFQKFLLPSFFIFLVTLIGFFYLLKSRKKKTGKIIIVIGILLYYFFSTTVPSNFLLSSLENKYSSLKIEDIEKADKLVLLLGGREADVLRGIEVLRLSHLRNNQIKIVISGTDPLLPNSEEALAVKQFFVQRGLEEENIIIEGRSRNTWESVRNVKEIVGENPFFLVTSAYHMERAIKEFEKLGANPIPAPTDFKVKAGKYNIFDFLPDAQNLRKSDFALHEHFGILFYKFR